MGAQHYYIQCVNYDEQNPSLHVRHKVPLYMYDYIRDIEGIVLNNPPLAQMEGCYVFDHNLRRRNKCSK